MELENLRMKCECGGKMERTSSTWKGIAVRAWKCKKCKEEIVHPVDAQKALEIDKARKKNKLKVKLRKVGKSYVVTVPPIIRNIQNLKRGQVLEWEIEDKRIVLKS